MGIKENIILPAHGIGRLVWAENVARERHQGLVPGIVYLDGVPYPTGSPLKAESLKEAQTQKFRQLNERINNRVERG